MKPISLGVLLIVPLFMMQSCFGGKPECDVGKDFQTELAHVLGVSEMEGDDENYSIFDGSVLKLFHNSKNDKDERNMFSSEEGYSVDNGVIKSSEFSRTYSHLKMHIDSDLIASVLRDIMPLNAPNKRVVLAFDIEPSYRDAVVILALIKNAYSNVDVSMYLSHPYLLEILKVVNPQIVLVSKLAYHNYGHIFEQLQTEKSGTNPLSIFSVDEGVDGLKYLFSGIDGKRDEVSSTSCTNTNDVSKLTPLNYPLNNEAFITFTSGSTGAPKIVVHSACNMLRDARSEIFAPSKSVFLAEVMHGLSGYGQVLLCSAYGAMCIPVFFDDQYQVYDEETHDEIMEIKVEELLVESNVSAILSPPMHIDLMIDIINELNEEIAEEEPDKSQYSFDTVETILTYGVKMSPLTFNNILRMFAPRKIINTYGSSETLSIAFNENVLEGKEALTIHPNVQVSISNHQQGEEGGEVFIKSNAIMLGYLDPSGNAYELPLDKDGWFSVGDYAKLDENGDLILLGRSRPSLNFAGEELDPTRIARSWEGFLKGKTDIIKYKEELIVVRDLQHSVFGHAAIVFLRWEKTLCNEKADDDDPSSSCMFSKSVLDSLHQVLLDTSSGLHQRNANELSNSFWAASAICFVDDFPRVGVRGKVNYLELERMYMEEIKAELILKGNQMALEYDGSFHGDSEMHILLTSLQWDGSRYEVMDWIELQKM